MAVTCQLLSWGPAAGATAKGRVATIMSLVVLPKIHLGPLSRGNGIWADLGLTSPRTACPL